ncbi:MAG: methyltransferase [Bacteroidetes bacterium]|nr:methyltransferase [Bacteroidota bacterium]
METLTASPKTNSKQTTAPLHPEHILQVGMGFWASKTLLAALKFRLFTILGEGSLSALQIKSKLGLHERSLYDFLDTLVSLNFLQREGIYENAVYSNTPETDFFLDKNKPSYLGGILEMCNNRLYRFWGDLEEGLITGNPQNELKHSHSKNQFEDFYSNPEILAEFMQAMAGIQMGAFMSFAHAFDFSKYTSLCDAGGATGILSVQVALNHPHMHCITYDLPAVAPIAESTVSKFKLGGRIQVQSGDFFKEALPKSDVVVMGNILHDWNEEEKLRLFRQAYDALPSGGAFVCIEAVIDNERKKNTFGLLMSLNMLIETKGGSDYTMDDFSRWAKKTGFSKTELIPLAGPTSAAIAYK